MVQFLNDTFWIKIIAAVVLLGITFYFTPKLVKFLDDFFNRNIAPQKRRSKRTKSEKKDKKS